MYSEIKNEFTVSGENLFTASIGEKLNKGRQQSVLHSITPPTEKLIETATAEAAPTSDVSFHESLHCDSTTVTGE